MLTNHVGVVFLVCLLYSSLVCDCMVWYLNDQTICVAKILLRLFFFNPMMSFRENEEQARVRGIPSEIGDYRSTRCTNRRYLPRLTERARGSACCVAYDMNG